MFDICGWRCERLFHGRFCDVPSELSGKLINRYLAVVMPVSSLQDGIRSAGVLFSYLKASWDLF